MQRKQMIEKLSAENRTIIKRITKTSGEEQDKLKERLAEIKKEINEIMAIEVSQRQKFKEAKLEEAKKR